MGFISSASSITLTAKLTPIGRQKLLTNSIGVITKFSLGDSDANYNVEYPLTTGQVPTNFGNIGPDGMTGNSSTNYISLRSVLYYNSLGNTKKPIDIGSGRISVSSEYVGFNTISGASLSHNFVNRTNTSGTGNTLTNLFFSFGLPITEVDKGYFSALTNSHGGFSDTGLSGLNQDNVLVIGIDNSSFGELIDGKTIKIQIQGTGTSVYTIYGTYMSGNKDAKLQDAEYRESASKFGVIANNLVFLFSDTIKKPNGNVSKSWSTGWNQYKSFSVGKKEMFNLTTTANLSKSADTAVGIAYLDKGFIVITDQTIVNAFNLSASTATTVGFNSVVTRISQDITCISNRGEFGSSTNTTFAAGDTPRITEVGLYDDSNNLIAIAKTDRQIESPGPSFLAMTVKIIL